jgi:uncharacterized membrane protein
MSNDFIFIWRILMIIPMNFVIGAAAGAVTTYVLKDDSAKQWAKDAGSKIKSGASSLTGIFKKKPKEEVTEDVKSGEVIEGEVKDVTDKATDKATA